MKRKKITGLSLVELLIAVFVLSIGILGTLLFFNSAMRSTDYANDITAATVHGEYVLEEILTRDSLANIAGTDWAAWAESAGLITLPEESITVTIANAEEDPLSINATVEWVRNERDMAVTLSTQVTK